VSLKKARQYEIIEIMNKKTEHIRISNCRTSVEKEPSKTQPRETSTDKNISPTEKNPANATH
jgi:hypothetical protein